MRKGKWKFWVIGLLFSAGWVWWSLSAPPVYDQHQAALEQQFHLPAGVDYQVLASEPGDKFRRRDVQAVVQFTPEQYRDYVSGLGDPDRWALVPFEWDDIEVVAEAPDQAVAWADGAGAFAPTGEQPAPYLVWGQAQDAQAREIQAFQSFCFAVVGEGGDQRIFACRDLSDPGRPDVFVRGMIDAEGQRLVAYISG